MDIHRYVLKFPPQQMTKFRNWCKPESCYVDRDSSVDYIFPASFWEAMVFESYEDALAFKRKTQNAELIIALQSLSLSDMVIPS
jgi:hypothetical protein